MIDRMNPFEVERKLFGQKESEILFDNYISERSIEVTVCY